MDPSALLHPVGPQPPRIYWLRRALLLGVVLIAVLAAAYACTGGSSNGGAGPRADGPGPVPTTTSPTPAPVVHRCGPKRLHVEAATDADTYPVGSAPRLTAVVSNASDAACRLATQPSARSWSVSSASDQVWS